MCTRSEARAQCQVASSVAPCSVTVRQARRPPLPLGLLTSKFPGPQSLPAGAGTAMRGHARLSATGASALRRLLGPDSQPSDLHVWISCVQQFPVCVFQML